LRLQVILVYLNQQTGGNAMNALSAEDMVQIETVDGLTEAELVKAEEVGRLLHQRIVDLPSLPSPLQSIRWQWGRENGYLRPVVTFFFRGCSFEAQPHPARPIAEIPTETLERMILVALRGRLCSLAGWLEPAYRLPYV